MSPIRQEHLWVLRAQMGDREAMNQLFLAVQGPLDRFLRSLGADDHRAEDLLQEVFVTIYRKLRWLREPAQFRAWSYRIAHRLAMRRLSSELREREQIDTGLEIEDFSPAPEVSALPEGDMAELLAHVSPKSRAVLALHFEHGLELAEIADVLEIPIGTVKSREAQGLAVLRRRLSERDPDAAPGAART